MAGEKAAESTFSLLRRPETSGKSDDRGVITLAKGCRTGDIQEMAPKNATLWAFVGTLLVAALLVGKFVVDIVAVLRGLIPAVRIFSSFIYAFASVTVTVFFFVFYRDRSR